MQLYRPNTLLTMGSHNKPIILFLLGHLRILASQFFRDRLASSTRSTYNAGQQKFINFCTSAKVHPVPTTEATLMLFSTHLAAMNISYATIKVYLAAVRYLHVSVGLHNHFSLHSTHATTPAGSMRYQKTPSCVSSCKNSPSHHSKNNGQD